MRRQSLVAAALTFCALLGLSCSSRDGQGDLDQLPPKPAASKSPIAEARKAIPDGGDMVARAVVVIAVDTYDETGDGKNIGNIYVQDQLQGDYSGLVLFNATKNPPDLVLSPGHWVDVLGPYQPFKGPSAGAFPDGIVLPEVVKGAVTLVAEGTAPAPVDVSLADLADSKTAMKFVGRLVRMKNVTLTADFDLKYREAPIVADKSVVLGAQFFAVHTPIYDIKNGTKLAEVTGVLNYFYSWKLCPRSPADIKR